MATDAAFAAAAGSVSAPVVDLGEPGGLQYRLKRCRHGWFVYNLNDMYIGRSLDAYGEYSEDELDLMLQIVRAGHVVVEAGANIGSLTVPLARRVGTGGSVFAFEPERMLNQILGANVALNGLRNVATIRAAVGAEAGFATMPHVDHRHYNNHGALQVRRQGPGDNVPVRTIDSLGLRRCHFVKIDVEGMELDVLRGADQTIRKLRPVIYVENNPGPQSAPLIAHIVGLGYRLWWHITPLFRSRNFFGNAENVFGHAGSANMLCVHETTSGNIRGLRRVEGPDDPPPIGPASELPSRPPQRAGVSR